MKPPLPPVSGLNLRCRAASLCGVRVSGQFILAIPAITLLLFPLNACRKPADAQKSDLEEAGYQLTTENWLLASSRDDVSALKKFIAAGYNSASVDAEGSTALHAAAATGAKNSADFLLKNGLTIDLTNAQGRTPLMAAVLTKQSAMVRWLLRQGADPRLKDKDGYAPLMLAVREGAAGAVEELAPYHRESLDSAILLAALVGQADVIDTLTNYGASVYARMEDGRTPLMIAAENGHAATVELLLDLGSSRFSTDAQGRNAADLADAAGHPEIVALISREPSPQEMTLETPEKVAQSMNEFVNSAAVTTEETAPAIERKPPLSISGAALSATVKPTEKPRVPSSTTSSDAKPATFPMPPLVMRHYRERDLPLKLRSVEGETAIFTLQSRQPKELKVRKGETIPGSRLSVIRIQRRTHDSKLNLGQPMEISVVEVRDAATGVSREWISGMASSGHDPLALVEDAATGQRYTASPGQKFKSSDGAEFVVSDVRPNQIIIEDVATGAVETISLHGPKG